MAYCPTNKTRVLLGAAGSVLPRRRTPRTEEQLVAMLRMMDPPDDDDCTVAPMPSDDAAGSPTSLASRDNRRPLIGDDRYRQVTQSGRDQYRSYLALRQERPPIRPMYPAGRLLHVGTLVQPRAVGGIIVYGRKLSYRCFYAFILYGYVTCRDRQCACRASSALTARRTSCLCANGRTDKTLPRSQCRRPC